MDDDRSTDDYITLSPPSLPMPNLELYKSARISPISLTYYAYCMSNGNYTVSLHFAEIEFSDDKTYKSLGRRLFDIYIQVNRYFTSTLEEIIWYFAYFKISLYIFSTLLAYVGTELTQYVVTLKVLELSPILQGKLEVKDFNIADAAGGVGKPFVQKFTVSVTNGSIEIRLFWAGKGTNSVPMRGIYGPLISAISVDPGR